MPMREPRECNRSEEFLGIGEFRCKIYSRFPTIAELMRRLTKRGVPFVFGPELEQQESFRELKSMLAQAETLRYFDRDAKTKIICDASPVGLWVILLQEHKGEDRVICYV